MLRVQRNNQRRKWVREKRPAFHFPIGQSKRLQEIPEISEAHIHTQTQSQVLKLKGNIVGAAELLFVLINQCVWGYACRKQFLPC